MKNVKIEEYVFIKVKEYCNKNGLKIYSWVSKILMEEINKNKKSPENK